MTFLLQKFNAINRSRTEVRVRKGLRPTASGIAFTGRLAVVCLLLAGFLGVGSAIAQPHVLRMGDGSISVVILDNEVHHYLIDTDGDGDMALTTAAGSNNIGTPYEFVVLSAHAPRLRFARVRRGRPPSR